MNGIFLVDKPTDMTSFGVVARLRRVTGQKCGHSGTLDPMATGLLPVMVGKATKLCDLLTEGQKNYVGTLRFGTRTDTGDITGAVLEERAGMPAQAELEAALPQFTGVITQRPPIYSAIKVDGVPLYRHAYKGREVEVPTRQVEIHRFVLLNYNEARQEAEFEVECSKGTYIRTLFSDLAEACGCIGTMSALRRVQVGTLSVQDAIPLEELMEMQDRERVACMIPMEQALCFLPAYEPPAFFATLLANGCAVAVKKIKDVPTTLCRVYRDGVLIGLGQRIEEDGETCFKVTTHL